MITRVGPDAWADWRMLRLRSLDEDRAVFSPSTQPWTGADDTEARWRGRLEDGPCFVAYESGVPVGMVAGRLVDEACELTSMWVAPEARRRGVGDALVRQVVEWAAGRPLSLRVMDGNGPAVAAYEKHGFVLVDGDGCVDDEGCRRMVLR